MTGWESLLCGNVYASEEFGDHTCVLPASHAPASHTDGEHVWANHDPADDDENGQPTNQARILYNDWLKAGGPVDPVTKRPVAPDVGAR